MKANHPSTTATADPYSALQARRRRSVFASIPAWAASLFLLVMVHTSPAQWVTQTVKLTSGWNAVYLHVDLSHTTLANLVGARSQQSSRGGLAMASRALDLAVH